jgi:hypothetical protein
MTETQRHTSAHTPLPEGWISFASKPDGDNTVHWYATSPYPVDALKAEFGRTAQPLSHTVTAPTWPELHAEVATQAEMYQRLTGEV